MTRHISPATGRKIHVTWMLVWAAQMVVCASVMDWDWKLYLLEISLWANFATHLSGWSAERPSEVL